MHPESLLTLRDKGQLEINYELLAQIDTVADELSGEVCVCLENIPIEYYWYKGIQEQHRKVIPCEIWDPIRFAALIRGQCRSNRVGMTMDVAHLAATVAMKPDYFKETYEISDPTDTVIEVMQRTKDLIRVVHLSGINNYYTRVARGVLASNPDITLRTDWGMFWQLRLRRWLYDHNWSAVGGNYVDLGRVREFIEDLPCLKAVVLEISPLRIPDYIADCLPGHVLDHIVARLPPILQE